MTIDHPEHEWDDLEEAPPTPEEQAAAAQLAMAAMADVHNGLAEAQEAVARIKALDVQVVTLGVDVRDLRAMRRELRQLDRVTARAVTEADDVHAQLNEIIAGNPLISPMFGK